MRPELLKYLYDIERACGYVAQFVAGKTKEECQDDMLARSAIERQFIIIGEALQHGFRVDATLADSIDDARRIVNFRNILIHGYSKVEWELVWDVIQNHLPGLKSKQRNCFGSSATPTHKFTSIEAAHGEGRRLSFSGM